MMEAQPFTGNESFTEMSTTDDTDDIAMQDAEEQEQIHRLKVELVLTDRKLRRACEQVDILTYRLREVQERYSLAKERSHPSFLYSYRLQMAVIERVRKLYQDYAQILAEKTKSLELQIFGEVLVDSDYEFEL